MIELNINIIYDHDHLINILLSNFKIGSTRIKGKYSHNIFPYIPNDSGKIYINNSDFKELDYIKKSIKKSIKKVSKLDLRDTN